MLTMSHELQNNMQKTDAKFNNDIKLRVLSPTAIYTVYFWRNSKEKYGHHLIISVSGRLKYKWEDAINLGATCISID